jgi:hypothetical protein
MRQGRAMRSAAVWLAFACAGAPLRAGAAPRIAAPLPDLAGAGTRWSAPELRLRLVDPGRLNPATIMPAYYKTDGLARVSAAMKGKPILTAQQVEDVVAYLQTLRAQ